MRGSTEPCPSCGTFCRRWGSGCAGARQADDPRLKRMTYDQRVASISHESVEDWVAVENGEISMSEKRRRDARRLAEGPTLTDEEREWLS